MHIKLVLVSSLNGKVTRDNEVGTAWSSKEDQEIFREQVAKNNLIVMGSGTYEPIKDKIKPEPHQLRIVLTSRPEVYRKQEVKGTLEFVSETPSELVQRLSKDGYEKMLLVSGPAVTTGFFNAKLINEVWVTLEPLVFGEGKNMTTEKVLGVTLILKESVQLNAKGTLLLKYDVAL